MHRLSTYLFRQLLTAFIFAAGAVAFVIIFTQSFRLLSLVIDNSSTLWIFFKLMGLSIPTFLPLVLPLGLGVAVVFVYHKLAMDSELVVMRAAGMSPMRLAAPSFGLAVLVTIAGFILTIWITPAANRRLVNLQSEVHDSYAIVLSRPGNFNDITDGLTFYARKRGANGALEGILMHDVRKPDMPVTLMADTGQVIDNNGQPQIVVFNGRRQQLDIKTGKLSELAFDQYVLDLDAMRGNSSHRMADPREQTIPELLNPSQDMLGLRATRDHLLAEVHQRLASPLLALSYVLIGLAAILAGEFNRRGMGKRILIAGLTIVVVQAVFMSLSGLIAQHIGLAFMLYLVVLVPMPIGLLLLNMEYLRRYRKPMKKASVT
jgi:lipopolysaccharide export system permease protein